MKLKFAKSVDLRNHCRNFILGKINKDIIGAVKNVLRKNKLFIAKITVKRCELVVKPGQTLTLKKFALKLKPGKKLTLKDGELMD